MRTPWPSGVLYQSRSRTDAEVAAGVNDDGGGGGSGGPCRPVGTAPG